MTDYLATTRIVTALETLAKSYERQVKGFRANHFESAANAIAEELEYTKRLIRDLERGALIIDQGPDLVNPVSPSTLKNK